LYDKVIADTSVDQPLRDLARVRAAYLLVDNESIASLKGRLAGLNSKDSPWRHAAREVLLLSNVKAEDIKQAAELATEILTDPATPAAMRARVQLVSSHLESLLPAASN
jgi:hypothetical protein